jgi:predicted permease
MAIGALAQAILGFTAIVGVGALLRAVGLVRREDARPLNAVIIYVGLPAFVFNAVHGADVRLSTLWVVAVAWLVFATVVALALAASRLLHLDQRRAGGFVLAASLGNTGYIGYPLTAALLGVAALPVAVFYDVFGTVFQLVLVGFPLARRFGGGPRLSAGRLARELATFPALVAAVLALALSAWTVPDPVSDWLGLLASMVAPMIMLSVGISLRPKAIAHGAAALAVLATLRLLVAPALAALFGTMLVSDPATLRATVLEAGMPSMMLSLAVGERFGLDDDFIASAIFVTTALSALTVPLAQVLLGG